MDELKKFLKMKMVDTTVADTFVIHAGTTVITIVLTVAAQGWINYLQDRKDQ